MGNAKNIAPEDSAAESSGMGMAAITVKKSKYVPRGNNLKEYFFKLLFMVAAAASVAAVALICYFLFSNGLPPMIKIGPVKFLTGREWRPNSGVFGIFPMIIGSIYTTAGAIILGVPVGILTAVFLSYFCPKRLYSMLKPSVELLAGIPSIVYGFFGLVVIVPFINRLFDYEVSGKSVLTVSVILSIMILPTITNVSEAAIKAVPKSYYEGALALGSTKEKAVFFTVIPAAKSGILAPVILGIGRAVGETMAVVMISGNKAVIPESLLGGVRTLTANIVLEMGYAAELHRGALIATGVVLFVFILIINLSFSLIKRKSNI